jgi:hypothetical protein
LDAGILPRVHLLRRQIGAADPIEPNLTTGPHERIKEPNFSDHGADARQKILDKFRARPAADDPTVKAREAERAAAAASRAKAKEVRDAEKAEKKKREAEAAVVEAARIAREKEEEAARAVANEAEQKAKRDARYAARREFGGKTKK